MSLVDEIAESPRQPQPRKPRVKHPQGFTPGLDTAKGEITAKFLKPIDDVSDAFTALLHEWGFDPALFAIDEDRVEIRTWDAAIGNGQTAKFYYYKAKIARRRTRESLNTITAEIRRHRPTKTAVPETDDAYVIALSDWQMGKRDGDGTDGIARRVLQAIDDIALDLRRVKPARVVIAGLGDIVEGCVGHYPMQTYNVELDRRGQVKVARRLLLKAFQVWTPLAPRVDVTCVPGNHGENRLNGKAFTTFGDNDDVAVFEQVAEVLEGNPDRYGHVSFHIPTNELTATIDLSGTVVGFAHGHQAHTAGRDGLAHTKTWTWWKNQAHGRTLVGDADILVTGHFHYLAVTENGTRTHIQVPALDHSDWFVEQYGYGTQHGVVTFNVNSDGWSRLRIHR